MRPSLLASTLTALVQQQQPVLIEGTPGGGKTQVVEAVAKALGYSIAQGSYVHLHGPTLQPEDLGLPAINADALTHQFTIPAWFPDAERPGPAPGILMIDELSQADVAVQKTLANLIQQRELHGHQMKPDWCIIATGNRQEDGAGANRLLSHLRDRLLTVGFDVNSDDWTEWALKNGVRGEVIAFLRWRPDLLNNFKRENKINATPRGWAEGVSRYIGSVPPEAELECFQGRVGEGPAAEFVGFLRMYRELPDPDVVLANPETAAIPEKTHVMFALCSAIAHRADAKNFDKVMAFATRLPPEFTTLVVRDCMAKDETGIVSTKAFIDWAANAGSDTLL